MHFNKLRLSGFKSFVDPTELTILAGLTGVVGPNGCGKSNLLEALRWVLGETRASAMRGSGMDDVIFTGTATRHAKNFAEVVIFIDNQQRRAPPGFNDSDLLEVSRRITRDIGSAYKINGKDVRAKDVQMLFADASTGAQSPSLVRQGQISELINAKPKNRRRILEEAAGISGLYQRRHEAELKLRAADSNLVRVDDVLDQLSQQMASLQRQARHAARYREIGRSLRAEEAKLAFVLWHMASVQKTAILDRLKEARIAVTRLERDARERESEREKLDALFIPAQEEDALASAILQKASLDRESLRKDTERAQSRVRGLNAAIAQLDQDMRRENELNADAQQTTAALERERLTLETDHDGHDQSLGLAQTELDEINQSLTQAEKDVQIKTENVASLAARQQSLRDGLVSVQEALTALETQHASARTNENTARVDAANAQTREQSAQATLAIKSAERDQADKELAKAELDFEETQQQAHKATQEKAAQDTGLRAIGGELKTLERLLLQMSSHQDAVLSHIDVIPGYEKALGAALGDELQRPLSTHGTGWREQHLMNDAPDFEPLTPLLQYVSAPPALHARLAHVFVADTPPANIPVGIRIVSQNGDMWRWDGYCQMAEDVTSEAARRLETINRETALKKEQSALEAQVHKLEEVELAAQTQVHRQRERVKTCKESLRIAEIAMSEAERNRARAQNAYDAAQSKLETAQSEQERLSAERAGLVTRQESAKNALAGLEDITALRASLEKAQTTLERTRSEAMTKRAQFQSLQNQGQARTTRMAQIEKDFGSWQDRLDSADQRQEQLKSRKAETQRRLKEAQAAPAILEAEIEQINKYIQTAEKRCDTAKAALAQIQTDLRQAASYEREAQQNASGAREALARVEAQFDAATSAQDSALHDIQERYDSTPDALAQTHDFTLETLDDKSQVEANVQKYLRQRDALGAVNLRAEEDMKEVAEEHETLAAEKTDLEEAIATLRAGISNLNKEGRERLRTAFEQVNVNFSQLFTHLFGGGEAQLVMVESDDPLEAGLEIMCQPPGKKLSTLSLLSGGEQTLTALALIFAVFLANPAPICVLDEVDAPLDDANVNRFCDMLDEMCRQTETRFLIITHHALTMARMERLFGVTMQEKGVSQLVSVDLRKAEKMVS